MKGRVVWVVDGDTIHVRLGTRVETVRDIGVNAPEVPPDVRDWQKAGRRAGAVDRARVAHRAMCLDLDVSHRDGWGRLLTYSWVTRAKKPVMANAEMIRRGSAQVRTIPPNVKHQALFLKLQRETRQAGRGLRSGT